MKGLEHRRKGWTEGELIESIAAAYSAGFSNPDEENAHIPFKVYGFAYIPASYLNLYIIQSFNLYVAIVYGF